jgi:hypothetical protein
MIEHGMAEGGCGANESRVVGEPRLYGQARL